MDTEVQQRNPCQAPDSHIQRTPSSPAIGAGAFFFAAPLIKLVMMAFVTLGLYVLYWFHRDWKTIKLRSGDDIMPFWRALFSPIWAYSCFREIKEATESRRNVASVSPGAMAATCFLLNLSSRLPGNCAFAILASVSWPSNAEEALVGGGGFTKNRALAAVSDHCSLQLKQQQQLAKGMSTMDGNQEMGSCGSSNDLTFSGYGLELVSNQPCLETSFQRFIASTSARQMAPFMLALMLSWAGICTARANDEGQAYIQCLAEGAAAEAAIGANYKPTLGHRCINFAGGYICEVLAYGDTAWAQWIYCSYAGKIEWWPITGTCSARPDLVAGAQEASAGTLTCNQGCEYGSLNGDDFQPTGSICPAPEPKIDPGKNNCCEVGGSVTAE